MQRFVLTAVCILLFSAAPAWADFYRYVDRDGRDFFVNDLKQIPQEYRNTATVVKPDAGRVHVGDGPVASGKARATVNEHRDKYGRGELFWRKRADALRKQLRAFQDKHELIVEQEKGQEGRPRKLTAKKSKSLAQSKAQLERKILRKKRELEVDLPEEARRADAYPGWIRE